jgi:hypothetical protein
MNRRVLLALALAFAFAFVPLVSSVYAHHNMTAIFDFNDRVTLTGTLKKVDWRNPHIYLTLEVKDAGNAMEWQAEGPSPTWFRIRDIGKENFANSLGQSFDVELSRARDKSPTGLIRTITLPGGRVVSACPQNC